AAEGADDEEAGGVVRLREDDPLAAAGADEGADVELSGGSGHGEPVWRYEGWRRSGVGGEDVGEEGGRCPGPGDGELVARAGHGDVEEAALAGDGVVAVLRVADRAGAARREAVGADAVDDDGL